MMMREVILFFDAFTNLSLFFNSLNLLVGCRFAFHVNNWLIIEGKSTYKYINIWLIALDFENKKLFIVVFFGLLNSSSKV